MRTEKKEFNVIAGQCVNIGLLGAGVNREYSLYSGERDQFLEFLIKVVDGGDVSPKLQKAKVGDIVELDGPYGLFTIKDSSKNHVFIGTGTGIAPFHTFTRTYPNLKYKIIHGIRKKEEMYESDDYNKNSYVSCVSQEEGGDFYGRVTEYIKKHDMDIESMYYLCGNRNMISEVFDLLIEKGINGDNIITEVFF
jgi:ferredoxin-NADP reductase